MWRAVELRIVDGFERARLVLSRQVSSALFVSPSLRQSISDRFEIDDLEQAVAEIIDEVRTRGDEALRKYTLKFDMTQLSSLEVGKEQVRKAYQEIDSELLSALKLAAERIGSFHQLQKDGIWAGVARMGGRQLVRPLERVGVYAPGGTAYY
ncbi:unnamed protein product, partial [marine sediment metagenome]